MKNVISEKVLKENHIALTGVRIVFDVQCTVCHNQWGIRVSDLSDVAKLPLEKFVCGNCLKNRNKTPISEL